MMRKGWVILGTILLLSVSYLLRAHIYHAWDQWIHGPYTINERLHQYGNSVKGRLASDFSHAGVNFPPETVTLLVFKKEKQLQLYAGPTFNDERFIRAYPILAASGHLGPKLREGDWQVPEGNYAVESLNPNSIFHLALRVGYPNADDLRHASEDGRRQLGGDIMIHGSNASVGCVAMGDSAAEDLFVLTAMTGIKHVRLLFCPFDFRVTGDLSIDPNSPAWTPALYAQLASELRTLPLPTTSTH